MLFNEPIKAIIVDSDDNPKKDKAVILGTASGKLVHHKQVWFTHKNVVLFNGTGLPVISVSWRRDIVVWADLKLVRIMNIASQSAVCFISSPNGVGPHNPFPCHLFWESDEDLFIAWADNLRHVEITRSANKDDERETTAKTIMDYQLDCIACGVSSFDSEHLAVFGCVPPSEESMQREGDLESTASSISNRPEVKIIKRSNGDIISSDVLPMNGQVFQGPWDYHFLSSFMSADRVGDAKKWNLSNLSMTSSDNHNDKSKNRRFLSPILVLMSPMDIVFGQVRDVNDRIGIALQNGDLTQAVNLAASDRLSLRHYQYDDILTLYIEDLFDRNEYLLAAKECARLVMKDVILWERWIYVFIKKNRLLDLLKYIPISNPLLPESVYQFIMESLFLQESFVFLTLIEKWGRIRPPLFSHSMLINRLESSPQLDPWAMEGLAQLYLWNGKYERALNRYLDINYEQIDSITRKMRTEDYDIDIDRDRLANYHNISSRSKSSEPIDLIASFQESLSSINNTSKTMMNKGDEKSHFIHVFELIEKENLYDTVREKIINLFRLSRELSANLLAKNVDKFPIASVVRQLKFDKKILLYYLHYMFHKYDPYNNDRQYAEFHVIQVSLYAEFSTPFIKSSYDDKYSSNINEVEKKESNYEAAMNSNKKKLVHDNFAELIGLRGRHATTDSHFMTFLRRSNFFSVDHALKECEKKKPPLYHEMVYLLDVKDMRREALVSLPKD